MPPVQRLKFKRTDDAHTSAAAGAAGPAPQRPRSRPVGAFNGVKVFSATMQPQREQLGDIVTDWIARNRSFDIVDIVIRQSSDESHHCLSITIFYNQPTGHP